MKEELHGCLPAQTTVVAHHFSIEAGILTLAPLMIYLPDPHLRVKEHRYHPLVPR